MIKFKEQVKLLQISEDAWIVNDDTKRVGILHKTIQDKFTYVDKTETILYDSEAEVKEAFQNKFLFRNTNKLDINQPATFYIKGYEVDYPNPVPVDPSHKDYMDEIPLFAKTENCDVYYAAGWYAINFEKGWKHGYCPVKYMPNNQPNDIELFVRHINHLFDKGEKQVTLDVEYLHRIAKQLNVDVAPSNNRDLDREIYVTGGKFKE